LPIFAGMKSFFINTILVLLLSTFVIDTLSGVIVPDEIAAEMNDGKTDGKKDTGKDSNFLADKIFTTTYSFIHIASLEEISYLDYAFFLPIPYVSGIELPPDLA
jgi:hypothetical protein